MYAHIYTYIYIYIHIQIWHGHGHGYECDSSKPAPIQMAGVPNFGRQVRFCGPKQTWRATTNTSVRYLIEEMSFLAPGTGKGDQDMGPRWHVSQFAQPKKLSSILRSQDSPRQPP